MQTSCFWNTIKLELPEQVLELGAYLYSKNPKISVKTAFETAEGIIKFNSKLEKEIRKCEGDGIYNKKVKIIGEIFEGFPEATIYSRVKGFSTMRGTKDSLYTSILCEDNRIYCKDRKVEAINEINWDYKRVREIEVLK